jgi:hypothetical protein
MLYVLIICVAINLYSFHMVELTNAASVVLRFMLGGVVFCALLLANAEASKPVATINSSAVPYMDAYMALVMLLVVAATTTPSYNPERTKILVGKMVMSVLIVILGYNALIGFGIVTLHY